ncbi:MAG: phenylalanine--tRNA ligase subunit alpha [Armatimonadota bacterium]|nr:phenylalanine--tRNA ligase subunit alpha [Armatimonadota bacterium]
MSQTSVHANLDELRRTAMTRISEAASLAGLAEIETTYLGRKGQLTQLLRSVGELPAEDRPTFGRLVNEARVDLEQALAARREELAESEANHRLRAEALDVTLPGRFYTIGRPHPLSATMDEIKRIFIGLGYDIVDSPEIEHYHYNFESLNYPEEHPAMDEQMSFYITDELLLRTQTTAVQARIMEKQKPPLKICTMGRCYRSDAVDATHSHTFHQVDCFAVDKNITFADLKGTLYQFAKEMFGSETRVRFRPDYFPFVEPGAEVAISCVICGGQGCGVCKSTGWLELGGAGLIHPNVFRQVGIDPEEYSGFAFGLGIDRMPMMKHRIDDLRLFLENDIRFLRQI